MTTAHDFQATAIDGRVIDLRDYAGKLLLIVNVASRCGYTPQYEGLERLYREHRARGFLVLGFPCNQFGAQEPGTSTQIQEFCSLNYDVSFPMFEKVDVNGPSAHPLFQFLCSRERTTQPIEWNFTKFLVDGEGQVVERFEPGVAPEAIEPTVVRALA